MCPLAQAIMECLDTGAPLHTSFDAHSVAVRPNTQPLGAMYQTRGSGSIDTVRSTTCTALLTRCGFLTSTRG